MSDEAELRDRRECRAAMELEPIVVAIRRAKGMSDLSALLREWRDGSGLSHLVYHAVHVPACDRPNPVLLLTYDEASCRSADFMAKGHCSRSHRMTPTSNGTGGASPISRIFILPRTTCMTVQCGSPACAPIPRRAP